MRNVWDQAHVVPASVQDPSLSFLTAFEMLVQIEASSFESAGTTTDLFLYPDAQSGDGEPIPLTQLV